MRAAKTDTNQSQIVDALRKAGCYVRVIGSPVDLLVGIPNGRGTRWMLMEVKQPLWKRPRADQSVQAQFIALHHVPVVKTEDDALIAAGLMRGSNVYSVPGPYAGITLITFKGEN